MWLLTSTEDIAYYVYDSSSSSSYSPFVDKEAEPARSLVHRVWGPDDQAQLVADQWGFGRRLSDEDDAGLSGHEHINWRHSAHLPAAIFPRAHDQLLRNAALEVWKRYCLVPRERNKRDERQCGSAERPFLRLPPGGGELRA